MLVAKKIKKKFSNSFLKASVIVALFVMSLIILPANNTQTAHASLQDELKAIQDQISQTNQNIETKKQEADSLSKDVALFDGQIQQTELKIQETTQKIAILEEQITQTEQNLETQKETLNEYLRVIYEESNTSPLELIASANSFSDFVDRSEYLQTMQIKIRDTVDKVKRMKADLEKSKKDSEIMKDQLNTQRSDLSSKKAGKESLLALTKNDQANFEKAATGLQARKGVLYCQIYGGCEGDINGSLKVVNDGSFPYYSQRDYTSPKLNIPEFGCLVTSYAMVRSHLGTPTNPTQEAERHSFSDDSMQGASDFGGHPEVNLGTNWNAINMALDNGKPVIAGLSMGSSGYSTHFVVLIGRSGDSYFVNDPYFGPGRTYNTSRVFKALSY